jgi:hypothetical protein
VDVAAPAEVARRQRRGGGRGGGGGRPAGATLTLLGLTWTAIGYGAALSGVVALAAVFLTSRRASIALAAGLSAVLGPLAWNAILRDTGGSGFFHDAPVSVLPVSWQDTGSGVFTLAVACLLLGGGPLAPSPGSKVASTAFLTALAAFLVDVYLY